MLAAAAAALAGRAGCSGAGGPAAGLAARLQRGFAEKSGPTEDYSLVMTKAAEVSTECASAPLPPGEGGVTYGVPLETFKRKALIVSLSRSAGQQGLGNTAENAAAPAWRIEFEPQAKWQNPLQGWNSTADPLENVGRSSLFFFTKEQAIAYAAKSGWAYEVAEPQQRRKDRQKRFADYGMNYTTRRNGNPDLSHLGAYAAAKASAAKAPAGGK